MTLSWLCPLIVQLPIRAVEMNQVKTLPFQGEIPFHIQGCVAFRNFISKRNVGVTIIAVTLHYLYGFKKAILYVYYPNV
mgnify:CR=1 FL=1